MISSRTTLEELEALYAQTPVLALPQGPLWGRFLLQLPHTRVPHILIDRLGFDLTPYGVDFTTRRWFFFHQRLQLGRFDITPGPSRWRDTESYRLRYDPSRLPIKDMLYDEVKPLPDGTVLGLGGVNQERGKGDHFFFLLR